MVPSKYLKAYRSVLVSVFDYIYPWDPDESGDQEPANINLAKTRGIVASAHDGIVSISGLDNGEVVKFYAADGKLLGSSSAVGGVASCAVSEKMVIAKIGMNTIKVLIK